MLSFTRCFSVCCVAATTECRSVMTRENTGWSWDHSWFITSHPTHLLFTRYVRTMYISHITKSKCNKNLLRIPFS